MEGGSVLCQRRHPSELGQILKRHRGGFSPSKRGTRTKNPLVLSPVPYGPSYRRLSLSLSSR